MHGSRQGGGGGKPPPLGPRRGAFARCLRVRLPSLHQGKALFQVREATCSPPRMRARHATPARSAGACVAVCTHAAHPAASHAVHLPSLHRMIRPRPFFAGKACCSTIKGRCSGAASAGRPAVFGQQLPHGHSPLHAPRPLPPRLTIKCVSRPNAMVHRACLFLQGPS